jgi:phosphohistidine phosphatase
MDGVPAPDLAICSDAVRTRQTAELLIEATGRPLPLDSYRSLYGADTDLVLRYLREIDEGVTGALVVGHNPVMHHLIWELVGEDGDGGVAVGAPDGRAALEAQGFPTCALAVLAIGVGGWEDLALGGCTLVGLFKPPY